MEEVIESGSPSRYDMSYYTFRQLQRDHIRFEEKYTKKFGNNFICRILINYMCYAQDYFAERFEKDIVSLFDKRNHNEYKKMTE